MGLCHKCKHDCTAIDPCPCCRKNIPRQWYIPDYPTTPKPWTETPRVTCENLKPKQHINKVFTK